MEVVDDLQNVIVDEHDSPVQGEEVTITRCGQLEFRKKKPKTEKTSIKGDKTEQDKELDNTSNDQTSSSHNDSLSHKKDREDRGINKDPHHKAPKRPPPPRPSSRQDPPQVILKGRGAMKYREHHSSRRNKSPDYGRLR